MCENQALGPRTDLLTAESSEHECLQRSLAMLGVASTGRMIHHLESIR
jgi:hypothetical protein